MDLCGHGESRHPARKDMRLKYAASKVMATVVERKNIFVGETIRPT